MISFSELEEKFGIGIRRATRLIEAGKLTKVKHQNKPTITYVTTESVYKFIAEQKAFLDEHIYAKEALEKLNIISPATLHQYKRNYKELNKDFTQEVDFMKVIELPENYYGNAVQNSFFKKKDIEILKNDYINLVEAKKLAGVNDSSSFKKWLKRRHYIQIFSFGSLRHQKFIRKIALKDGILNYQRIRNIASKARKNNIEKEGFLTLKATIKKLNLSSRYFNLTLGKEISPSLIRPNNSPANVKYFKVEDVLALINKQKEESQKLSKSYYSRADIKEIYPDLSNDSLNKGIKDKIEIPPYLTPFFKSEDDKPYEFVGKWLYNKKEVKEFIRRVELRGSIYSDAMYTEPYKEYTRRINILRISFPEETKITEKLWNEYVFEKLKSSEGNQDYTISNYIITITRAAEAVTDNIEKEIYEYKSSEINLLIMKNQQITRTSREFIYQFLLFVDKVLKFNSQNTPFNINKIINPRTLTRSTTQEKKIYSDKEYSALFYYSTKLSNHKEKAVTAALNFIDSDFNIKKYNRYDSAWLYVLLHLNNAWRNSDCINVPRISLEGTSIKDLQWLLQNDISNDDVKRIIFRMKATDMNVSKTGAVRNFFCAPEVEKAIATAIAICELRTRAYNDKLDSIVFKVNSHGNLAKKPKKAFFKDFELTDFDFKNRAMNRTLIGLIAQIQSVTGNSSDTEYLRILRSHLDFETTDIYINISRERLDEITLQLFDRDMFGHIPDILAKLLFGETTSEFQQTKQIKMVKNHFGDIYKIEETAAFLNEIQFIRAHASQAFLKSNQEYKDIVEEIIRSMSHDDIKSLYKRIITGQMPSKKKNYQCIVSETSCRYPGRDCNDCPLSIPHFFALSSLIERIFKKAKVIEESFLKDIPSAEKTRLANSIELDLQLLTDAQKKYGKQEVALFASGLNEKLKLINPIRAYKTSRQKSEVP